MIRKSEIQIIVRAAGERTEQLCSDVLRIDCGYDNLRIIHEIPFSRALSKGFEIGLKSGKPWLFCIDADVLVDKSGIDHFLKVASEMPEEVFEIQSLVRDKFFPLNRPAGNHLYRMKYAEEALKCIPKEATTLRPEGTMLKAMAQRGYLWYQSGVVVGVHDYEQYYADIFRKCFLHAHKHRKLLHYVAAYWVNQSKTDPDFAIALHAALFGIAHRGTVLVEKDFVSEKAAKALGDLGLEEKKNLLSIGRDGMQRWMQTAGNGQFDVLQDLMAPAGILNRVCAVEAEKWGSYIRKSFSALLLKGGSALHKLGRRINSPSTLEWDKWFSLIDKVARLEALEIAWCKVARNKGAAEVDGQSVKRFEHREATYLQEISQALTSGAYKPQPVKRVEIPKRPGKKRPLGIPAVKDRSVQTELKIVIVPIFEHEFAESSYGFRPGRWCKDALREVDQLINQGFTQVVDADMASYFDTIPHDRLMTLVEQRIGDGKVLDLIRGYLGP